MSTGINSGVIRRTCLGVLRFIYSQYSLGVRRSGPSAWARWSATKHTHVMQSTNTFCASNFKAQTSSFSGRDVSVLSMLGPLCTRVFLLVHRLNYSDRIRILTAFKQRMKTKTTKTIPFPPSPSSPPCCLWTHSIAFVYISFHFLFLHLFPLTLPLQDEGDEPEEQRLRSVQEDGQRQTETHRRSHQTATQPHRAAPHLERASRSCRPIGWSRPSSLGKSRPDSSVQLRNRCSVYAP